MIIIPKKGKPFKLNVLRFVSAAELRERILDVWFNHPFAEFSQVRENFVNTHGIHPKFFERCLDDVVRMGALEVDLRDSIKPDGTEHCDEWFIVHWAKFFESEVTRNAK